MKVMLAFMVNVAFNFVVGLLVAKFLGPSEYGRFALALATAVAVQTAFLDWLRLGATRFYSERARGEEPGLRATLDISFAIITLFIALGTTLLFMTGIEFPLSHGLIALALAAAVANGLFDFNTALVRARFHDALYIKLVIVKNILAFTLTGGGAFLFGSARMALLGGVISLAGSVVFARAALSDPGAKAHLARRDVAASLLRYAMPIVAAHLLYYCIPLANRALISVYYGFAETGQFSLAWDVGSKAVQAIGSMLDVLLFQIAVRAHDRAGDEGARQRIADNMGIVVAVLLPACAGIWLVLPSVQQLVVPQPFRGPFETLLTLMMPGLFAFATILYAINPIFQIAKRTAPLIAAAVVGCIGDPLIFLALPSMGGVARIALAQSGAFVLAAIALLAIAARARPGAARPAWPRARDGIGTVLATIAMVAAVMPMRGQEPGIGVMAAQILLGLAVYGALVALFDIAALRTIAGERLAPIVARHRTG